MDSRGRMPLRIVLALHMHSLIHLAQKLMIAHYRQNVLFCWGRWHMTTTTQRDTHTRHRMREVKKLQYTAVRSRRSGAGAHPDQRGSRVDDMLTLFLSVCSRGPASMSRRCEVSACHLAHATPGDVTADVTSEWTADRAHRPPA
ncbi:hypothetical protein EVAR_60195_1 [Eumeta japonica]|uniref:Secreted protein n=1 Tax=Eumeta variegata TaxID=151549 RepID=A0A4C1Z5Z5_EUMVA|nr:hypothetical protein EVAR_60195_1 [Eumeta japonica]